MKLSQLLDTLPFVRYEKEALLYLATVDAATAKDIYKNSSIPQGRIYGILQELRQKGLVMVIPTSPQQYQIKDVKLALQNFIRQEEAKLIEKSKQVDSLQTEPRLFTAMKAPSVAFLSGREEHLHAIITMRSTAKKELLQVAPLFVGTFASNRSLSEALSRGIGCKIIIKEVHAKNKKVVDKSIRAGAEIRVLNSSDLLSMLIKDSEELLLGVQNYHQQEERVTLYTKNKALISALEDAFWKLWKIAKSVKIYRE